MPSLRPRNIITRAMPQEITEANPVDESRTIVYAPLERSVAWLKSQRVYAHNVKMHQQGGYSKTRKRSITKGAVMANKRIARDTRNTNARLIRSEKASKTKAAKVLMGLK